MPTLVTVADAQPRTRRGPGWRLVAARWEPANRCPPAARPLGGTVLLAAATGHRRHRARLARNRARTLSLPSDLDDHGQQA